MNHVLQRLAAKMKESAQRYETYCAIPPADADIILIDLLEAAVRTQLRHFIGELEGTQVLTQDVYPGFDTRVLIYF